MYNISGKYHVLIVGDCGVEKLHINKTFFYCPDNTLKIYVMKGELTFISVFLYCSYRYTTVKMFTQLSTKFR